MNFNSVVCIFVHKMAAVPPHCAHKVCVQNTSNSCLGALLTIVVTATLLSILSLKFIMIMLLQDVLRWFNDMFFLFSYCVTIHQKCFVPFQKDRVCLFITAMF